MKLELKRLQIDGGTQPRVAIHEETVADYAEALKDGATFPPVVAFHDGVTYWLADGFHRYHAHRRAGLDVIEVDVQDGTLRDAILYSVGANTEHGLRRTNADKRKCIEMMLSDREWSAWADRDVARRCGVDHKTVANCRASLGNFPSEKPESDTVERTYRTKHGTKAKMNTRNIGRGKKPKISPDARMPVRGHSKPNPKVALELPRDPDIVARTVLSVFGTEFAQSVVKSLNDYLAGKTFDPLEGVENAPCN